MKQARLLTRSNKWPLILFALNCAIFLLIACGAVFLGVRQLTLGHYPATRLKANDYQAIGRDGLYSLAIAGTLRADVHPGVVAQWYADEGWANPYDATVAIRRNCWAGLLCLGQSAQTTVAETENATHIHVSTYIVLNPTGR